MSNEQNKITEDKSTQCTYDCDQCGKTYQDNLYPKDSDDCCYCPDCRDKKPNEIAALLAEVENMKCCANCKHGTDSTNCGRVYFVLSWSYRCEKGWQSDSLTAEQRRK
jgi:hypothetical protein